MTAQLDPRYRQTIEQLQQSAGSLALPPRPLGQRQWPTAPFPGDILDPALLTPFFERSGIEEASSQLLKDPRHTGPVGHLMALQLQSDQVAARERSWRSRLASPVRLLVHAAARKAGHAAPAGVHGLAQRQVQDLLSLGEPAPPAGVNV